MNLKNKNIFLNKSIFVTGGTGSFGHIFVERLIRNYNPKKIIVYSRDEYKQFKMNAYLSQNKYTSNFLKNNKFRFFIGDIRDKERLSFALKDDIDYVFHAAALKHVPICEYNPFEAVKTNILGAQNLIESCMANGIKKVVALSTDKASSPINLYGATKLTSDKLFIAANNYKGKTDIKFSVVRYGNVMGSRGSVIPTFIKNSKNKFINITDKSMSRFNITLDQSVDLVIKAVDTMVGGELYVPKLSSYNILDLMKAVAPKAKPNFVGIRPGEKLHEEMISQSESQNTIEYKDHFIILPNSDHLSWNKKNFIKTNKSKIIKIHKLDFSYNSKDNSSFLSVRDLKSLIKDNFHTFYLD